MRLLLDTHALLWWLEDPAKLEGSAREGIASADMVFVSAAVAWEISIKRALGKLQCPEDLESVVAECGFRALPVSITHAMRAGDLAGHHSDPFDRMLVAQAQSERLTLVTGDAALRAYGVDILAA
jgi:PIN domain nuclease of toxin-antitoxin system